MNKNRGNDGRFTRKDDAIQSTGVSNHPFYPIWAAMLQRCENKNNAAYHNYGARGISVCHEWHDSSIFIAWLENNGYSKGLDIDRMDNDGNYCPGNCHTVTRRINARNGRNNRPFLVHGERLLLCEIEEKYDVLPDTFLHRVFSQGRTAEDALIRRGKLDIRTRPKLT